VPEHLREALGRLSRPEPASGIARAAQAIARLGGPSVRGVVFFGSRRSGVPTDAFSAYDFFVVVEGCRAFYEQLRAAGAVRRSPVLLSALNACMPPNQLSLQVEIDGRPARAKCAVIRLADLLLATGPRRKDHFCAGRLFQPATLAHASDGAAGEALLDALVSAHEQTLGWVRPWLPARFDAEEYARVALRVSMSWEVRPEPGGRADALFAAQRPYHREVFGILLEELSRRGELVSAGEGRYALARPVGAIERLRLGLYFRLSLARATLRWFKYMITYEGWVDYILHKASRHTGYEATLSERERRWPWLFLWPRLFRFFRHRDGRR
jgi:hypothetical protein